MSLIPYGLNPDEVWEVDFAAVRAQATLESLRATSARLREEGKEKEAGRIEERTSALEAELGAYVPGSGPIFQVGHIPNAIRAEISGEAVEAGKATLGVEWEKRDLAWSEKVVRWSIRGHRNLRTRSGAEVPFETEEVEWDGRKRKVPSRATLEAYQEILGDLSIAALRSQRLDGPRKNA